MCEQYFVFIYTPGANWRTGQALTEQPYLDAHSKYMGELEKDGTLKLGGGFIDNTGAMGIIEVDTLETATLIVERDPIVRHNVVKATIHPFWTTVASPLEVKAV